MKKLKEKKTEIEPTIVQEKKTKVVMIDGGIGRVICAIPAIEKLAETNDVIVISSWLEPFINNNKIKRLYHVSHPYLWEDIISKGELLHPEPYFDHNYYTQKHHLIQSFNHLLNNDSELNSPNIYFSDDEKEWAKQFIGGLKQQFGNKKVVLFQPFGATAKVLENTGKSIDIVDQSNRSLTYDNALLLADELEKDCIILYMGNLPFMHKKTVIPSPPMQLRQWISVINEIDYMVGVDSSAQHIAYALNKKGTIILGATYKENISYKDWFNIYQKDQYPKTYDPIRLPSQNFTNSASEQNKGAMNFSNNQIREIAEIIKKDLK